MLRNLALGGLTALLLLTTRQADATATLRVSSGGDTITVEDQGAGDSQAVLGIVRAEGAVGNFNFTTTMGFTKPFLGSASNPNMDILSFETSGGAGTLTVEFTETDFVPNSGVSGLLASIGGTSDGTVSVDVYIDTGNTAFGQGVHVISFDAQQMAGTSFAGALQNALPDLTDPYSITFVVTVVHDGRGTTSFDGEIRPVPEPATAALLGMSGVALLAWTRRRRRQAV